MKTELNDEEVENFAKKTYREVTIWDWLGRILPLSVLAIISVCQIFGFDSLLDLIIEISVVIFFIICFIWWYWAIYKIAITVRYMRQSHQEFISVRDELRKFKETFTTIDTRKPKK